MYMPVAPAYGNGGMGGFGDFGGGWGFILLLIVLCGWGGFGGGFGGGYGNGMCADGHAVRGVSGSLGRRAPARERGTHEDAGRRGPSREDGQLDAERRHQRGHPRLVLSSC